MDPERARELLVAERKRIERSLSQRAHEDPGDSTDADDPGNQGTDLYQDEFDEGLAEDLREDLAALERAEARLAAGTYGLSVESGQPIPDERLEAVSCERRRLRPEEPLFAGAEGVHDLKGRARELADGTSRDCGKALRELFGIAP